MSANNTADMFGEAISATPLSPAGTPLLIPRLSVLNARAGEWQDRKRAWMQLGIKSEVGRADNLLKYSDTVKIGSGTSIFDPVLCELAYRWFSGAGAQIIDPFSGGSVRGIIAAHLGRRYWGCDLRAEQIAENRAQAEAICAGLPNQPEWVCGDSMQKAEEAPAADLLFTCPPYGDLEEYSSDPLDLSHMTHAAFLLAYRAIIAKACQRLRDNRFACIVVGDFRDPAGNYRNFVSDTIAAFLDAGLKLHSEAILQTSLGTSAMRVTKIFGSGRKFCKTHQNVLVFVKGSAAAAMQAAATEASV